MLCGHSQQPQQGILVNHTQSHYSVHCLACSGSGKSTLLDILAQRKTTGKIQGEVLIAGQRPTQTFLRRFAGYVEQFDTLLPVLTVYEMLLYTAELKTPRTVHLQVWLKLAPCKGTSRYQAVCTTSIGYALTSIGYVLTAELVTVLPEP